MEVQEFTIKYSFNDILKEEPLGTFATDFVNEIEFNVYLNDSYSKPTVLIAKGKISQILFSLAADYEFSFYELMNATQAILEMSEMLFDFDEESDFWAKIDAYFQEDVPLNQDICYLDFFEILPNFRKKGIGKKIITSLVERFYSSCGLWILQGVPTQHSGYLDNIAFEDLDEWDQKMAYDDLDKDFEKSQYKLFNYFQQMGFQNPFDRDYFIAEPYKFLSRERNE